MSNTPFNLRQLQQGSRYQVVQDFVDFYQNRFTQGEMLTFVEFHFLPYHGGYTVIFKERNLYLQEDEHANLLDALGDYLRPVTW